MASIPLRIALLAGLGLLVVPLHSDAAPTRSARRAAATHSSAAKAPKTSRAPKPLAASKRLVRINALLSKLGKPARNEVPPVSDGLTPIHPLLDSTTMIRFSNGGYFMGPNHHMPNGRIYFYGADTLAMELGFRTEAGKIYVLDCAVQGRYTTDDGAKGTVEAQLAVEVEDISSRVTYQSVDGHVLHAFVATKELAIVELGVFDRDDLGKYHTGWYGCSLDALD